MLLCGYWAFHREAALPLSELFPYYCIVRAEEIHKNPRLSNVVDLLSAEYLSQRPGAELVIDKLT